MVVYVVKERTVGFMKQYVVGMKQLAHLLFKRKDAFLDEAGVLPIGLYIL